MVRLMFFAKRKIESSNVVLHDYTPIVGECIYIFNGTFYFYRNCWI